MIGGSLALAAVLAAGGALAGSGDLLGNIGDVRLKGYLGKRLDAMIANHVAGQDVDYITAPFMEKTERRRSWQTEFWGKWMHSAVPYERYLERGASAAAGSTGLNERIGRGLERILASQEKSGYIGNYPDELRCGEGWDVWGMKYTMMGLLHYYDGERGTGKRALEAAKSRYFFSPVRLYSHITGSRIDELAYPDQFPVCHSSRPRLPSGPISAIT